ncbi:hypothetical protein BGZ70_009193 [Mortierella alpina]|uniref:Pre-rRNA processing protein n=1 Tax=Mortierella alpina TaxID=64518 RepID=A0A9P6J2B5_MORAP|nr:hypothetical protein BGZ70_009193 [Mortierella alpina]
MSCSSNIQYVLASSTDIRADAPTTLLLHIHIFLVTPFVFSRVPLSIATPYPSRYLCHKTHPIPVPRSCSNVLRIREEGEVRQPDESREDTGDEGRQSVRPKFYRHRKFWLCCIPTTIIAIIIAVLLAYYVIIPKIAQGLMDKAAISFYEIDITDPTTSSMSIVMKGEMTDTGPYHAEVVFPGTVTVSWEGKVLGTTLISGESEASDGRGDLHLQSNFSITDAAAFTEFTSHMLNAESFVWHIEGKVRVKALGRTFKDLDMSKDMTVKAFNGLPGVTIEKFSLPGDDPNGKGIIIAIDANVTNPSAIHMYMGSLTLAISYKDTLVGYVTTSNLTMVRGSQVLSMKGVLVPQTTPEGLGSNLPFDVVGHASVFAKTSIGTVNLVNIPFQTTTELRLLSGLQSLTNPAPTIKSLQVVEGTPNALTMAIDVEMVNPSSITLSAGDVALDLFYKSVRLGTVKMLQLKIVPGVNTVQTMSTIDPAATHEGLELLHLYTRGAGADVNIVGTPRSAQVWSP